MKEQCKGEPLMPSMIIILVLIGITLAICAGRIYEIIQLHVSQKKHLSHVPEIPTESSSHLIERKAA
jgi:hypothetical protein